MRAGFVVSLMVLLPCVVMAQAVPFQTGFEPPQFFSASLPQNGWTAVEGTAAIQSGVKSKGYQALQIDEESTIDKPLTTYYQIVYIDAWYQANDLGGIYPDIESLQDSSSILIFTSTEGLVALNGDGDGGGTWQPLGVSLTEGSFYRITIRQYYKTHTWDVFFNGDKTPIATGLGFRNNTVNYLSGFTARSSTGGKSYLDDFAALLTMPDFLSATDTPTQAASFTPTGTPTYSPTATATETEFAPTHTPTGTPTRTYTPTYTRTYTPTYTRTYTPTYTPTSTSTYSPTPTSTDTDLPTSTETPTETPTIGNTETPTDTKTPTDTPTIGDTETPTETPTDTEIPTDTPTLQNTETPTITSTVVNTDTPTPTASATPPPAPVIYLLADPVEGPPGTLVEFTAQVVAPGLDNGGYIEWYGWNFEANAIPEERTAETQSYFMLSQSHTYYEPGIYEATLFAWDNKGTIGSSTKTITIWSPTPTETPEPTATPTEVAPTPTSTPIPPILPPDLNGDGWVNEKDLVIFLSAVDPEDQYYDITNDGIRDLQDFALFVLYWDQWVAPEPPKADR